MPSNSAVKDDEREGTTKVVEMCSSARRHGRAAVAEKKERGKIGWVEMCDAVGSVTEEGRTGAERDY